MPLTVFVAQEIAKQYETGTCLPADTASLSHADLHFDGISDFENLACLPLNRS